MAKDILILSSGGMDSSACIAFYKMLDFNPKALFVNYGQAAFSRELESVTKVCDYYKIDLHAINAAGFRDFGNGFIQGRNAFLLFTALMFVGHYVGTIAMGIHSGTQYIDCTPLFVKQMQGLFDLYTDGRTQINAPFLNWTKSDIWNFCQDKQVPVELTYSCELGKPQPCGICLSCKDVEKLHG